MKRFTVIMTLGMVVALLVAACGGGDPTATVRPEPTVVPQGPTISPQNTPVPTAEPTTPPATTVRRGGVLVQADRPNASFSFQPGIRNAELGPGNNVTARTIYQPLFQFDGYSGNELNGRLVETWQFNDVADSVTIGLRPEANWADGMPVIAADVKFTLDNWITPPEGFVLANTNVRSAGGAMESVTALDDRSVRIDLSSPNVAFLAFLADPDAIMTPAHRTLEQSATDPVGSGAFVVTDIDTDIKFTLEKRANYWAKDASGAQLPYLDGVENIIIIDAQRAFAALLVGEIDLAIVGWFDAVRGHQEEIARSLPLATLPRYVGGLIGWGPKNVAPFNDIRVLRGLSLLHDRLLMVEIRNAGDGLIDGAGVIPTSGGGSFSLPTEEVLSRPGWRYLNRATGELEVDMEKLRTGLGEVYMKDPADIEAGKAFLSDAGMLPLPEFSISLSTGFESQGVVIGQNLKDLIDATVILDVTDRAAWSEKVNEGNFEFTGFAIYGSAPEPAQTLFRITTGNGFWQHGFSFPERDALFEQQAAETDPVKRKQLILEMQRHLLDFPNQIPGTHSFTPKGMIQEWVINMPPGSSSKANWYNFDQVSLADRT